MNTKSQYEFMKFLLYAFGCAWITFGVAGCFVILGDAGIGLAFLVIGALFFLASIVINELIRHFFTTPWFFRELTRSSINPGYRPAFEYREFGEEDWDFISSDLYVYLPPAPQERRDYYPGKLVDTTA